MANWIDSPGSARSLGAWGEALAADYLVGLGWQVVSRNWRCPFGELDLVGLEPVPGDDPVGVVVEVKCRRGRGFGDPLESITFAKLNRLRQLAGQWRSESGVPLSGLRIDAIGIVKTAGLAPELSHVRGLG